MKTKQKLPRIRARKVDVEVFQDLSDEQSGAIVGDRAGLERLKTAIDSVLKRNGEISVGIATERGELRIELKHDSP